MIATGYLLAYQWIWFGFCYHYYPLNQGCGVGVGVGVGVARSRGNEPGVGVGVGVGKNCLDSDSGTFIRICSQGRRQEHFAGGGGYRRPDAPS